MKHPQHIWALAKNFTDVILGLQQGVNHNVSYERFCEAGVGHLHCIRREELDEVIQQGREVKGDPNFRQILPYTLVVQADPDFKNQKIFAYQRTPKGGESDLHGKVSTGIGGHLDLADTIHENSVVNLRSTILNGLSREVFGEELIFLDANGHELDPTATPERFVMDHYGFLRDDSNPVGELHLAVVNVIFISPDITVKCREEELTTLGFFSYKELLASGYNLESWTRILLEDLIAH